MIIIFGGGRTLSFVTHRRTEHGATNLVALSTKLGPAARWALVHNKNLKKGKKSAPFSFSMKRWLIFARECQATVPSTIQGASALLNASRLSSPYQWNHKSYYSARERMYLLPQVVIGFFQGPHIRSSCAPDGTWQPYPTCEVKNYFGSLYPIFW